MSFNIDHVDSQKGKIAVVTGANSGIGKEITIGLARNGIKVIMACRNVNKAENTKIEIIKYLLISCKQLPYLSKSKIEPRTR